MSNDDKRRAQRQQAPGLILVTDTIGGVPIGRVGNLSHTGLMLISPQPLNADGLYQLSFELPDPVTGVQHTLEIGMNEQWGEAAALPGQYWTGLRFIAVSAEDDALLAQWLQTGNHASRQRRR